MKKSQKNDLDLNKHSPEQEVRTTSTDPERKKQKRISRQINNKHLYNVIFFEVVYIVFLQYPTVSHFPWPGFETKLS